MNTSAITWNGPLSRQEVAPHLTQALFGPLAKQTLPAEALRAEVLRIAIWEQSVLNQQQSLVNASVSTQKVLRRARLLWTPIAPVLKTRVSINEMDIEDDILNRRVLDELVEQGDLLSLSGGQWLPTPLRLVPIVQDRYLLVGGLPSALLSDHVLQELHLHGSFRQIEASLLQKHQTFDGVAGRWQFQTRESWLGAPPLTQEELLQEFLKIELLQQTTQYTVEVYVPTPDKPQRWRWLPLEKVQKNGRYLLRSRRPWGRNFYTIGHAEKRQIQGQSHILESWDIRRFCYALDAAAHMPTQVLWDKREGVLTLKSELPARERKLLATLGSLQANSTDHYYPRIWHIPSRYEQEVQGILNELGIVIR